MQVLLLHAPILHRAAAPLAALEGHPAVPPPPAAQQGGPTAGWRQRQVVPGTASNGQPKCTRGEGGGEVEERENTGKITLIQ